MATIIQGQTVYPVGQTIRVDWNVPDVTNAPVGGPASPVITVIPPVNTVSPQGGPCGVGSAVSSGAATRTDH
jgi:hypothetical protein